jgi:hypothetical protein
VAWAVLLENMISLQRYENILINASFWGKEIAEKN